MLFKRIVSTVVVFIAATLLVAPTQSGAASADLEATCIQREECCEVCDRGKACGNSCIRESSRCHKGPGCACDVEDVCD